MKQTTKTKLVLPIVLLLLMLCEGVLAIYFRALFITQQHAIIIQLSSVLILLTALHVKTNFTYIMTFLLYILYDAYYSPMLSFYAIAGLFTFSLVRYFYKLTPSFFRDFLVVTIGLLMLNSMLYVQAVIIGFNVIPFDYYFSFKIVPSVLFNLFAMILFYLPIKKAIKWLN